MPGASLTLIPDAFHGSQQRFDFLTLAITGGWIKDRPVAVEEALTSAGVDGVRWLHQFDQYPDTQATSVSQAATYVDAIDLARVLAQTVGRYADLVVYFGTASVRHNRVRIVAAEPAARPGLIIGGTGSPLASVACTWTLRATQSAGSAQ